MVERKIEMHQQILKIKPFDNSFKKIEKFCNKLESIKIKIKNIDVGGGLGINYSDQYKLDILWPDEFSTWTNAAVIIAADCVFGISKKRNVFLA